MIAGYLIPSETVSVSEEIKKSRFITLVAHTPGLQNAKAFIQSVREIHPTARHHCWACVAGIPSDSQQLGFSDDGEPAGTAGKPILALLMGSGIGEITAVVVRYYGGVKLGTGGLVKAYGSGVQQALKQLTTVRHIVQKNYSIHCEYAHLMLIETMLKQSGGTIISIEYGEALQLRISLPEQQEADFQVRLANISRGALILQPIT